MKRGLVQNFIVRKWECRLEKLALRLEVANESRILDKVFVLFGTELFLR